MNEEKLKEFNIELSALLLKYNCVLQINQGIVVVPKEEKVAEVKEGKKDANNEKGEEN